MSSLPSLNRRVPIFYHWSSRDFPFCRYVQSITSERKNSDFDSLSIGYVQSIISELTDSQISSSSPVQTFFCHNIQSITFKRQNSGLGGFSIGHVQSIISKLKIAKSHPLIQQRLFYRHVQSSPLNGRALNSVILNQYVQYVTSEPINVQISSSSPLWTSFAVKLVNHL